MSKKKTEPRKCKVGHADGMCYCVDDKPKESASAGGWEREFDNEYVIKSNAGTGLLRYTDADKIKSFIKSLLSYRSNALVGRLEGMRKPSILDWENYPGSAPLQAMAVHEATIDAAIALVREVFKS